MPLRAEVCSWLVFMQLQALFKCIVAHPPILTLTWVNERDVYSNFEAGT